MDILAHQWNSQEGQVGLRGGNFTSGDQNKLMSGQVPDDTICGARLLRQHTIIIKSSPRKGHVRWPSGLCALPSRSLTIKGASVSGVCELKALPQPHMDSRGPLGNQMSLIGNELFCFMGRSPSLERNKRESRSKRLRMWEGSCLLLEIGLETPLC